MELQSDGKIAEKHILNAWFQSMNISYTSAKGVKLWSGAQARTIQVIFLMHM